MIRPAKTTSVLIGFGFLAIMFAVLPLVWQGMDKDRGPRPLMGEVSAVAEETFSLTLRNGKTLTLYYSETLSPAERALIAPGARVQVAVDPVIDGRPEVVKVRTPKP